MMMMMMMMMWEGVACISQTVMDLMYLTLKLTRRFFAFLARTWTHHTVWNTTLALRRCALHFTKNALIWATVIDFEQRVLDRMSESGEVDEEEETKQENRIRKLYMRWIGVPGMKLDLAMQLYEEFENENADTDEDAARSIGKAQKIMEQTQKAVEPRLKFEKRISDATDKDQLFIAYVVTHFI